MTTINSAFTRIENLIAGNATYNGVYGRTPRGPAMALTVASAATTSVGFSNLTRGEASWYPGDNKLAGKHLQSGTRTRRIRSNSATTLVTMTWGATAASVQTGCALRDGFTKVPDSQRIEELVKDRHFQVRPNSSERLAGYGNGTERIRLGFDVLVAYQNDHKPGDTALRAQEDHAAVRATVTLRSNMVDGVNIFEDGDAGIKEEDENGSHVIWGFPFFASYYRTIRES